jgi:protein-disulfide isomerase
MKKQKNLYVMVGVAALLAAIFVFASFLYKDAERTEAKSHVSTELSAKIVGKAERSQGSSSSRVIVVEFLDPECESCRLMHPITKSVLAEFTGQVYFVLRYLPLHNNSAYAASVLEAAALQGKYWESLDVLFERQPEWGSHANPRPDLIIGYLEEIGVDRARLETDMKNPEIAKKIEDDKNDALALGVRGTPTFFVGGKMLRELGEAPLRQAIQEEIDLAAAH